MGTAQTHPLIDDYLSRLHATAEQLPSARRTELVSEIDEHIDNALRATGTSNEAAIRNVLERLGTPKEIVAAASDAQHDAAVEPALLGPQRGEPATRQFGGLEIAAIVALAVGGLVIPVAGVVVGVVLAWLSARWTRTDKLVTTALPMAVTAIAGLGLAAYAAGWLPPPGDDPTAGQRLLPSPVEFGIGMVAFTGPILGGVLAATYLAVQTRRRGRTSTSRPATARRDPA